MVVKKSFFFAICLIVLGMRNQCRATEDATFKIPNLPVVAHRGFSEAFPENTVAAAKGAIVAEAEGCEFDVRATKDGVIIVLHDDTLNRTTNIKTEIINGKPKPIKAENLTFEEIRKLDAGSWKNTKFSGEKVPTIDEMLEALKDSKCWPVIEIKEDGIEKQVIDAVNKAGLADRCVIISFSKFSVQEVKKLAPKIPVAWLWGKKWEKSEDELTAFLIKEANDANTNMVDFGHGNLSPKVVQSLKNAGLTVWAWTVDDPVRMKELREAGVLSITTNRPDIARP